MNFQYNLEYKEIDVYPTLRLRKDERGRFFWQMKYGNYDLISFAYGDINAAIDCLVHNRIKWNQIEKHIKQ